MSEHIERGDLTQGPILGKLAHIAIPTIASNTINMLYNLFDMFWMGRLGSHEVAATGAAGLYMWLSVGFMLFGSAGAGIGVAQSIGSGDKDRAKAVARNALFMSAGLGIIFGAILFFFRVPLVGFFNFQEANVVNLTQKYLAVVALPIPLTFISATLGSAFTASGDSRTPFICNAISMAVNLVVDPILIFPCGLGMMGGAYGTVLGQVLACALLSLAFLRGKKRPFDTFKVFAKPDSQIMKWITRKALPMSVESMLFTLLVMVTSRREAFFGADAVAMSRVGSQIESLTWLVGGAFGSALVAFVGQNYGAKRWDRIGDTYKIATAMMAGYGAFVALLLAVLGKYIFGIFLPDPVLIERSVLFMRIVALCQIPMCLEGVASSTFRGVGRTLPPAIVSITCNVIRVPLVYFLSSEFVGIGLPGVWWGVSITAGAKGIWGYIWYVAHEHKRRRREGLVGEPKNSKI